MIHPDLAGVRTLIFDMDGTLIGSGRIALRSLRNSLNRFHHGLGESAPEISDETIMAGIGAPSDHFYMSLLEPRHRDKWREFRSLVLEDERKFLEAERITFPGTIKTLGILRKRGYRMALVSNCGSPYLQAVLDTQNLRRHFELTLCIGDREGANKTGLIAEAAKTLGGKIALIGDRDYDVEAGAANGLPVVGALYGYGSREELFGTATWVEDVRHLLYLFNPVRELAARIADRVNQMRPQDRPFVLALDTPHESLSFPLTQLLLNELTELKIPVSFLHLNDHRNPDASRANLDRWIEDSYPWTELNILLRQRRDGMINTGFPYLNSAHLPKPVRARPGEVVVVEGCCLTGEWLEETFDQYVKLDAKPTTISGILRSESSLIKFSGLCGARAIPAEFSHLDAVRKDWKTIRLRALNHYEALLKANPNEQFDVYINGDELQKGLITSETVVMQMLQANQG